MPKTIEDIVNQTVGKMLDFFSIDAGLFTRWGTKDEIRIIKSSTE
jgi:3-polyprenyl-4-hydroxybenzoate decarboxylase